MKPKVFAPSIRTILWRPKKPKGVPIEMKFLQLHTLYQPYMRHVYRKEPRLLSESFIKQSKAVLDDGYGAVHMLTPILNQLGYDATVIFGNCLYSQTRWLEENQKLLADTRDWIHEIVRIQMETICPDIVYATDSETYDSRFFASVAWKPRLTIGWRGAPVVSGTDWSSFDVMLSHLSVFRRRAQELGARSTHFYFPGFPTGLAESVRDEQEHFDVVFSGQWTTLHKERNAILYTLAEAADAREFSLALFLSSPKGGVPPIIEKYNRGERWGLDMFKALRSGRIVINAEADFAGGEAGNMRLFETTGVGSFLLTRHLSNIERYFTPGVEIDTFNNSQELLRKIKYYLANTEHRNAIARKGRERCLREYALEKRALAFAAIVKNCLQKNSPSYEIKSVIEPAASELAITSADEILSPVTDSRNVTLKKKLPPESLIRAYQQQFRIDTTRYFKDVKEICMYECLDSGYRFFHPFHIEGDSRFYEQLDTAPWYYMDWKHEHEAASKYCKTGQSILEIGCARGSFLEALKKRGAIGVGLEHNAKAVAAAKSKQLDVYMQTIQEHAVECPERYDVVCVFQVMEHVSKVKSFIESALSALKPGGLLIISVPNHDAFMGLDEWNVLDLPPHHMGQWNENSLVSLENYFDLSLVEIHNEPLQPYHLAYYTAIVKKRFSADVELQDAILRIASSAPSKIKGFTTMAVYRKQSTAPINQSFRGALDASANRNSHYGLQRSSLTSEVNMGIEDAIASIKRCDVGKALAALYQIIRTNPIDETANILYTLLQSPEYRHPIYAVDTLIGSHKPSQQVAAANFSSKLDVQMKRHLYLNLGCGSHFHQYWTNVDFKATHPSILAYDLNQGVPFSDNTFDAVYHSHVLEHMTKENAPCFIKECHRVLKAGGILRVVVPDLEQMVRLYLELMEKAVQGETEAQHRYQWIMLELFDQMVRGTSGGGMLAYWRQNPMPAEAFVIQRMGAEVRGILDNLRRQPTIESSCKGVAQVNPVQIGRFRLSGEIHQWAYDRYSLGKILEQAGFRDMRVCRAGESQIVDFNTYHLDVLPDGSLRKPDSLFMEAKK
jgi:predicted SAM-dependent methyltransferase